MSEEKQYLQDSNFDEVKIDEDTLASLYVQDEPEQTDANVETQSESDRQETAEVSDQEPQEEQPKDEEEIVSNESEFIRVGEKDYSENELNLALESLNNRNDWQRSNTQKAQEIAEERKYLDGIVSTIDSVLKDEELKEALGSEHQLYKSIAEYEMSPEEEQDAIVGAEKEVENDRMTELENKLTLMETEKEVDREVEQLIKNHPELKTEESITEVLNVAVEKNLNLEDAFIFANATINGESALKKAIESVRKAEELKAQPEVSVTNKGSNSEPIPMGKSYDDIEDILLNTKHYDLFK